jgi:hypothetical protein
LTNDFFNRHGAVEAILDALPLDQSDFFLAHAGSLDIPKLRLMSITQTEEGHEWELGMASFKEFFFTHHFADYVLSRSSSKDSNRVETLRTVFADAYVKEYGPYFRGECAQLPLMPYTPNTLGVTGLVRVVCGDDSLLVLQRRGMHESAARGHVQLSYAGTINALPQYAFSSSMAGSQGKNQYVELAQLADDEFLDELMTAELGQLIAEHASSRVVTHRPAGFCLNSQYLFQPELFVITTIEVSNNDLLGLLRQKFSTLENSPLFVMNDLSALDRAVRAGRFKLRPLCATALDTIYRPLLSLNGNSAPTKNL